MAIISCYRGDHKTFWITVVDKAGKPVDVTGWSFTFSFARRRGETPLHQVAGVIEDASAGRVRFELTPTETAQKGSYDFDVQAVTAAGKIRTVADGRLIIRQDVTP